MTPGFFAALERPDPRARRDFNQGDIDGAERVVIISHALAEELFPGQNPLNRHLMWTDPVMKFIEVSTDARRIVGVAADMDDERIDPRAVMTVYHPFEQETSAAVGCSCARARDPYSLVPAITRTVRDLSAEQPVERAATLEDVRAEVLAPDRLNAIVFGGFAAVALAIAIVGVAGVLAFSVSGRIREFGIRMAIGSQPQAILAGVVSEGVLMSCLGVVAGAFGGYALAMIGGSYLEGMKLPSALPILAAIAATVLLLAAVAGSLLPGGARRTRGCRAGAAQRVAGLFRSELDAERTVLETLAVRAVAARALRRQRGGGRLRVVPLRRRDGLLDDVHLLARVGRPADRVGLRLALPEGLGLGERSA